ncbi:MAG: hypothetical protein HYR95_00755 [Candidatus Colwellbacteria bacterium]|nr:hypothetical protein [Candidatus Colwellbacteria bacterium]
MSDLFLQIVTISSLGAIIYLVVIAVPRTKDSSSKRPVLESGRWGANLPLDKIDLKLRSVKDKTLRRVKIIIMKADNFVSRRLNNDKDKI